MARRTPQIVSEAMSSSRFIETDLAQTLFMLYCHDVDGATIAYEHFRQSRLRADLYDEAFYSATCFACATRRVGRMLESMVKHRDKFSRAVSQVIREEWRKKRDFFDGVRKVRDIIEHVDEQAMQSRSFFNISGDTFYVSGIPTTARSDAWIVIDDKAMENIVSSQIRIAEEIVKEGGQRNTSPDPTPAE